MPAHFCKFRTNIITSNFNHTQQCMPNRPFSFFAFFTLVKPRVLGSVICIVGRYGHYLIRILSRKNTFSTQEGHDKCGRCLCVNRVSSLSRDDRITRNLALNGRVNSPGKIQTNTLTMLKGSNCGIYIYKCRQRYMRDACNGVQERRRNKTGVAVTPNVHLNLLSLRDSTYQYDMETPCIFSSLSQCHL